MSARGLEPHGQYALYALAGGAARRCADGQADAEGKLTLRTAGAGTLFLSAGERIALWEAGENPEESYLACSAALNRQKTGVPRGKAPKQPPRETPPSAPSDPAESPRPSREAPPPEAPGIALRPASSAPPVDALPILFWPAGGEEIRAYFDALPPFAPFYAPGWRFVRAPSPLPGTAYCAVGRYARDARVRRIAYAVPGTPQRPPAALTGYRYHQGFWIYEQTV